MSDEDPVARLPSVERSPDGLPGSVELGAFSVSLAVEDLARSSAFYEALGFEATGGDGDEGWLMLKNGETTLGLFQGMFPTNILTFNPGLTNRMETIEDFTDVRAIQAHLDDAGIELDQRVSEDAGETGAASIMVTDPDGNAILIDQFR